MKSLAHKRSSSVDRLRAEFSLKMAPRPDSPFAMPTERDSLLGSQKTQPEKKRPLCLTGGGPDSPLSWLVAFANFLINLLVVGLGRMSGLLYVVFMGMYHVDRKTASVPFAIQQAARNLFGPLAGILGQKYGVRIVTVVGGFIGTVAAGICFFYTDLNTVTVCWGLIFGICTALTTTLNQVPIDQYFERHRTTAGGLAFSGGCVGAFLFPAMLEALIHHYGMGGTFLVMAALILNVVPAAMILREPPWNKDVDNNNDSENTSDPPNSDLTTQHSDQSTPNTSRNYSTFSVPKIRIISFPFLRENSRLVYQLFTRVLSGDAYLSSSVLDTQWTDTLPLVQELQDMHEFLVQTAGKVDGGKQSSESPQSGETPESQVETIPSAAGSSSSSTDVLKHMLLEHTRSSHEVRLESNPRWVFVATKLRELAETSERRLLAAFPVSLHTRVVKALEMLNEMNSLIAEAERQHPELEKTETTHTFVDIPKRGEGSKKPPPSGNSFGVHLKTALRLHAKPLFLLICICRGVFMLTFIPMVTVVVDFAMDKGLRRTTGQYAIATLSLGDLVGRLCFGWVTDSGLLSLPHYMFVAMVLLGASTATLPLAHDELSLLPAVLVFGALQGSLFVRHQILVSQYMELHEQVIGMGFINFLSGFIGFGLPYYIGYFRDTMGSYDSMLYLNGAICIAVGLLWLFEPFFATTPRKRSAYRKLDGSK